MLCRAATPATDTLDTIAGLEGDKRDMGVTTKPTGALPPRLNLSVYDEGHGSWKVRCTLTAAVEGTNKSYYLAAGTYATGLAWWPESGAFGSADDDHTETFAILDETNSDWSRLAELEHCNDWLRAHALTLKAAEDAISHATPGLQNQRFGSRVAAYKGALEAFVAHSPSRQIAAIFQESIIATSTRQDFFPMTFKDRLTELFLAAGELTRGRDDNRWHHFEYGASVPNSQLGWMDYFRASGRDYRPVQRSARFSVGLTPSTVQIHL